MTQTMSHQYAMTTMLRIPVTIPNRKSPGRFSLLANAIDQLALQGADVAQELSLVPRNRSPGASGVSSAERARRNFNELIHSFQRFHRFHRGVSSKKQMIPNYHVMIHLLFPIQGALRLTLQLHSLKICRKLKLAAFQVLGPIGAG